MSHKSIGNRLKRLWGKILVFFGLKEKKKKISVDPWRYDPEFQALYKGSKGTTLVTPDRCFTLYQWAQHANSLEGDAAEIGVYKGGTAKIIAKTCPQKTLHLFDTFGGMPEVDETVDNHREGDFADTSVEGVKKFLNGCNNVKFHQGFFPKSTEGLEERTYSYVHIDSDLYQSIKDCLEYFYPRMTLGGVMLIDDYEWKDCPGVRKAIDEFLADKKEKQVVSALYQCLLIKL